MPKLLEQKEDVVLNKLLKIADVLRKAYKAEAEPQKNDFPGKPYYHSMGEFFAYKNLKNDEVLNPLVYYTEFVKI